MRHTDFKIVSDELRKEVGRSMRGHPLWDAVREGKTLFVTRKPAPASITNLKKQGYRLHIHVYEEGWLVWADKIEGTKG